MQSTFDIYSQLKKQLTGLSYRGVDLSRPAAAVLANLLYRKASAHRKKRSARKLFWREPKLTNQSEFKGKVVTWNNARADHKRNIEALHEYLDSSSDPVNLVHIADMAADYRLVFRPGILLRSFLMTLKAGIERQYFVYVWAALTYTMKYYDCLEKSGIPSRITKLISYNSSNVPECFLVAACNKRNTPTFSVQHSLYQDYEGDPPLDVINYENVVAQNLLVWSEFCRDQILDFYRRTEREMHFGMPIAGYLNFSSIPREHPPLINESNKILCLLPRDETASSVLLISLLRELDQRYEVLVRFHPVSQRDKILPSPIPANFTIDSEELLNKTLHSHKFFLAVGFNTTSLFDTLLFNIPCALFCAPDSTFHINELPNFSTRNELEALIPNLKPTPDVANYILGAHTMRYKETIGA